MNYKDFTSEDFVKDEKFIRWVKQNHIEDDAFWKAWLSQYPEKQATVEAAKSLIEAIEFDTVSPTALQIKNIQEGIHKGIANASRPAPLQSKSPIALWKPMAIAASFLLTLLFGYYLTNNPEVHYATDFGEVDHIELPDGSKAILNAHSTLRITKNWESKGQREVWLEGEAFFEVNPAPGRNGNKFIVHAGAIDVEVLGTQFNVNHQEDEIAVVLTEGNINLNLQAKYGAPKQLSIQRGERLSFKPQSQQLTKVKVKTQVYTSWKSRQLIFDDTPLNHLLQIIEQQYGYKVKLQSSTLSNRKLSGSLPNENLDVLLKAISTVLGLKVERVGNQVIQLSQ